ncbi:PAX-interacting protein 1-like [Harmonia axyridis]|uniref:PAX-interacting protein 1-like n=1 Tax=Harmonia axyridis TaxID=115357 RepID=UPI001E279862|nr:PAX-interacting protein 1-like [Harmonia axyridis]
MKHFILLFTIVALSSSEILSTEGPSQIIGIPGPRWQGPFANHILGQPVGDTPEVAAAKAAHYLAHEQILQIIPELPPQERYNTVNVGQPQQQVFVPQQQQVNYVPQQQQVSYVPQQQQVSYVPQQQVVYVPQQQQVTYVPQQSAYVAQPTKVPEVHINVPSAVTAPVVQQQVQNVPQFTKFAEDIPRSELGEVPEVAAARKAHLAAFEEIRKLLPKLEETTTQAVEVSTQKPQVVEQQTKIVTPDFQLVQQQPQVFTQQTQAAPQVPQVVYQQPQVKSQQTETVNQQDDSLLWRQQLQRNLDWFYNPQQFYSYLPQDTPEVAAAKLEHLKLLQALN